MNASIDLSPSEEDDAWPDGLTVHTSSVLGLGYWLEEQRTVIVSWWAGAMNEEIRKDGIDGTAEAVAEWVTQGRRWRDDGLVNGPKVLMLIHFRFDG
jgi:hypothetical protein